MYLIVDQKTFMYRSTVAFLHVQCGSLQAVHLHYVLFTLLNTKPELSRLDYIENTVHVIPNQILLNGLQYI